MRVLRLASMMSALEAPSTRHSAGALRRLAGGDKDDAPAKLSATLRDERWRVAEIEACKDGSGKGPLHFAAWRGSPKNVEILIDAGCDVEAPATGEFTYGKTPLFFAVTRCRDVTVRALLERGAATKIVNNKGQSVRAIAKSHLEKETYAAVVAAEETDERPWINWRLTKSDGLTYGDLDVRFLERPLEPTDVVDDVVVNPTTHLSRRGAFLRKNPGSRVATAAPPNPPKQSTYEPSEPPADAEALLCAVTDAPDAAQCVSALEALAEAWADRKGQWLPPLAEAVAEAAPRARLEAAAALMGDEGLAARLARRALGGEPRPRAPPAPPRAFRRSVKTPAAPPVDATLPRCELGGAPTWVSHDDAVAGVAEAVATAKRVAFDCEFSALKGLATLQVALDDGRVFVVDATLNLDPLVDVLSARRVLGFGVGEDLRRLPDRDWSGVDDLQRRFPRHKAPSLQRVVAEVLGEYVDKSLQRSDWDRRPLTAEQLRYAALDAAVLLWVEEGLVASAESSA